jgi:YggT family protein
MSPVGQGGLFFLQFIVGIIIFILLLRFFLRASYIDWHNPIVTFVAKITNPICAPFSKLIPSKGRWDFTAITTALSVQIAYFTLLVLFTDKSFNIGLIAIFAITEILDKLLDLMFLIIIIQVILSWLNQDYNSNTEIFKQMANPLLAPFQKLVPPISGIDLSPIIAILAIKLTQIIVVGSLTQLGQQMV